MNEEIKFSVGTHNADNSDEKHTVAQAVVEFVSILASAIVVIMLLFTFVCRIVGVSGPSMMNTLHNGDWLLVSAFITEPERGDIVIVTQPNSFNEPIVKRVIAVGGDTIDIDFETATVYINGEVLNEPYLATPTTTDELAWNYPITLKEGQVFVMGDNREHSTDSRSPDIGLIDENYILGQVMVRFAPIAYFEFFGDYDYE
ncbi:MAG: signal peptidase I [Clostridia bacterium]|nr:signal peptidase I [Clostridia bacterium]